MICHVFGCDNAFTASVAMGHDAWIMSAMQGQNWTAQDNLSMCWLHTYGAHVVTMTCKGSSRQKY